MKLIYLANMRLPTEKAHGLQIMQNCEAFAQAHADVELWIPRRFNAPDMKQIGDVFVHYGVESAFRLRRLPCIDLLPLVPGRSDMLARLIFAVQLLTFTFVAAISAIFNHADVWYSRDALILLALSIWKPRAALAYEAHTLAQGNIGRWLQRSAVKRAGLIVAVTARLADDLAGLGASRNSIMVAHDGIRRARFENLPGRDEARRMLGWDVGAFVVGYVGRLHTMDMDKGVAALVEAMSQVGILSIALVGGPDETANNLRAQWVTLGQEDSHFLYAGQVLPERVPLYLAAMDVCAMPFPWTTHFAYYASPIKLFEYMAAGRAVVASDLPSTAEVVRDEETALLYPPGDVAALASAIRRLREDAALRSRLGAAASELVFSHYTWDARARRILARLLR